jgi:hypothetical protein
MMPPPTSTTSGLALSGSTPVAATPLWEVTSALRLFRECAVGAVLLIVG